MIVEEIQPIAGEVIYCDNGKYIRYGADNWFQCYSSSDEEIMNHELIAELESAYQQFKHSLNAIKFKP